MSNFCQNYEMEHEEIIHNFYKKCNTDDESFEYYENVSDIKNQSYKFNNLLDIEQSISSLKYNDAKNKKVKENKTEIINQKEKYKNIFISDFMHIMNVPQNYDDFKKGLMDIISKDFNRNNKNLNDSFLDIFEIDLLYGELEMNISFQAEQNPLLENEEKEIYKDYIEKIEQIFILNNEKIKLSQKKKYNSNIGRRNKKIKLRVKSLLKYPRPKKKNHIKESSNEDLEGKFNSQKDINSDKRQNKNNNFKGFEKGQNSKDNIKNKEANNSFNNFEHDIVRLEFDEDSNECFDIQNDSFFSSIKDFSGRWPKKREKEDESSEEIMEGNSYDSYNELNLIHEESIIYNEKLNKSSQASRKTYTIANNSFSKNSINMSNTLIFPSSFLLTPSSDFSSSENLENFNLFNFSFKIEKTGNINDDNKSFEHLFFKKRKRENKKIFSISKINKQNKKLNNNKKLNFENNNNSCMFANLDKINQEFKILQNENNNKTMNNYLNKNNKKKANKKSIKKISKNIFSTKIIIDKKNILDNSHEKNKKTIDNLSDIDKNDDSFIKKKRKKVLEKIKEKVNIKRPYEIERSIFRNFRDYLFANKTSFEEIISRNKNFWHEFFSKEKLNSFSLKINDKQNKSFSNKLMKHIFSIAGVDELYKEFISDIQLQNKLKEKYDSYEHKIYQQNFHIIYCAKYKEEELNFEE